MLGLMTIVAIQGQVGSFHEVAAREMLGDDITILPCQTFAEVFSAVREKQAAYGVVATENTIHGKIAEVADLLETYQPHVLKDYWLPVELCLIGAKGAGLSEITKVYSQQIALNQCQRFLQQSLPSAEQIDYYDTAAAVGLVADKQDVHTAAIASSAAANYYGLPIVARAVQDLEGNKTHFAMFQYPL